MEQKIDLEGHRARLRGRFQKSGFEGFHEYEIVELLLTLCIPRRDVKNLAKRLFNHFGSIRGLLDASEQELRQVEGIGEVTPVALRIIRETANLYLRQTAEEKIVLNNSTDLEAFWRARLSPLTNEVFEVAYLDHRFQLQKNGVERLSEGTVNRTVIYPRQVMESALRRSASGLVLAHNHPTGYPEPSAQDKNLTDALIAAGRSLNIQIIDHIIVAANKVFSFRREGLISSVA
ncbi:MAG: hypothetical protein AUJ82_07670 [Verrucomicrobia bacterium CG1_02_43_26]|nr:MAG: hypothetical protein AUJ82_07670 [Verrucomicrobia bacterium CG1_02_43_26]